MRATLLLAGIYMFCLALTQASMQPMEKEVEVDAAVFRRRLAELGAVKCIRDAKISIITGAEPEYYKARRVGAEETGMAGAHTHLAFLLIIKTQLFTTGTDQYRQ